MKARDLLKASQDHIFIQPTGEGKDSVIGIPKKIGPAITQYLQAVVRGDKPVVAPEDEAFMSNVLQVVDRHGTPVNVTAAGQNGIGFERGPWMDKRKYRDSAYAVMAAMYTLLLPDVHHQSKTAQVESEMRHYTDHEVRFDHRTHHQGAFKAMDSLVDLSLVNKQRGGGFGGGNFFSLTQRGLKCCYQLFHVKFTPEISPAYTLVRPKCGSCETTENGSIRLLGGHAGGGRMLPIGGVRGGGGLVGQDNFNLHNMIGVGGGFEGGFGGEFRGGFNHEEDGYRYDGYNNQDNPNDHWDHDDVGWGAGAGAGLGASSDRKRTADDARLSDFNEMNEQDRTLDAEFLRLKRLKRFEDIATARAAPAAPAHSSSGSVLPRVTIACPVKIAQIGTQLERSFGEEADLETARLQTLLEYSEAEARREEVRRREEQRIEDMQIALIMDTTAIEAEEANTCEAERKWRFGGNYSGYASDLVSEQSVYDLDWEPPNWEQDDGAGGGSGESPQDEDYKIAVRESLLVSSTHKPHHNLSTSKHASHTSGHSEITSKSSLAVINIDTDEVYPVKHNDHPSEQTTKKLNDDMKECDVVFLPESQDIDSAAAYNISTPCSRSSSSAHSHMARVPASTAFSSSSSCAPTLAHWSHRATPHAQSLTTVLELSSSGSTTSPQCKKKKKNNTAASASTIAVTAADTATSEVINLNDSEVFDSPPSRSVPRDPDAAIREVISLEDSQEYENDDLVYLSSKAHAACTSRERNQAAGPSVHGIDGAGDETSGRSSETASSQQSAYLRIIRGESCTTAVTMRTVPLPLPAFTTGDISQTLINNKITKFIPPVKLEQVTNLAEAELVMLVDTRERFVQNRYRQFYFDIQAKCASHLQTIEAGCHSWRTEQDELRLGDLSFAYECFVSGEDRSWLSNVIVERKAVSDLISGSAGDARSRSGTARHVTQEMRLRHCGRARPFMLIEGNTSTAHVHAVPLVWRQTDHLHPDVINSPDRIVSYMCAVVARNYSPLCRVSVLQTLSNGATALLYAAFMAIELCNAQELSRSKKCIFRPSRSSFESYCNSLGGDKRGKEAVLRKDLTLASVDISPEIVARIVRWFGCWDALLNAYRICYHHPVGLTSQGISKYSSDDDNPVVAAELRCALLLSDLTVGGTHIDRKHLLKGSDDSDDEDDDCNHNSEDSTVIMKQDSMRVWFLARRRLFPDKPQNVECDWEDYMNDTLPYLHHSHKITYVELSQSMAETYLSAHKHLGEGFVVSINSPTEPTAPMAAANTSTITSAKSVKLPLGGVASHINFNDSTVYPNITIQSKDPVVYTLTSYPQRASDVYITIQRQSQCTHVAVVSAFDAVEALVRATADYRERFPSISDNIFGDPLRSVSIVRNALCSIATCLPRVFSTSIVAASAVEQQTPAQRVLILEGLVHPTSSMASAMGRLSRAVNSCDAGSSTVCLSAGRGELPLISARDVSANEAWLVQLLVACINIYGATPSPPPPSPTLSLTVPGTTKANNNPESGDIPHANSGWLCLLAHNSEQTERLLFGLVHETHRQSLLLY